MTYIIFTIAIIINIFNILLISNNNLLKEQKEKILLVTYSMSELLFLVFAVSFIEFTAVNLIIVLSFVCVWLLSKACICMLNMNFETIQQEEIFVKENNIEETIIEENTELEETIVEKNTKVEEAIDNIENINEEIEVVSEVEAEKIELSDIVENAPENILTPASLHDLSDIIESAKINKEEEVRRRRRSLVLRASKMLNEEQ